MGAEGGGSPSAPPHRGAPPDLSRRRMVACSLASVPLLAGLVPACAHPGGGLESTPEQNLRGARRNRPGQTRPSEETDHGPRPLLTETVGLLMQYGASRGDRAIFDQQLSRVQHHLRSPCGLLGWRASPDLGEVADSSASTP